MILSKERRFPNNASKKKRWYYMVKCEKCGSVGEQIHIPHKDYKLCKRCNRGLLTTSEFIEQATAIHGNKIDYSDTIYTGNKNRVSMTCKKHNFTYSQRAADHLDKDSKGGCPKCKQEYVKELYSLSKEVWQNRLSKYNQPHDITIISDNAGWRSDVVLHCAKHGNFDAILGYITHYKHICPECRKELKIQKQSKRSNLLGKPCTLYYIYLPKLGLYKLGCTIQPLYKRFPALEFIIIWEYVNIYENVIDLEFLLHSHFINKRINNIALPQGGSSELYKENIIPNLTNLNELIRALQ